VNFKWFELRSKWDIGIMERWNVGFEGKNNLKFKQPIIPVFQYSFIPSALGLG